jgi:hypothetical protein
LVNKDIFITYQIKKTKFIWQFEKIVLTL